MFKIMVVMFVNVEQNNDNIRIDYFYYCWYY